MDVGGARNDQRRGLRKSYQHTDSKRELQKEKKKLNQKERHPLAAKRRAEKEKSYSTHPGLKSPDDERPKFVLNRGGGPAGEKGVPLT